MTDPLSFAAVTPRMSLPQLFAAQAQKEFVINEALARLDLLLHCAVAGEANDPPADPAEGECWLVGAAPTGAWLDRAGCIAGWQAGTWLLADPLAGMGIYDRAARQYLLFDEGWRRASTPTEPSGGGTIDVEARAALAGVIESLRNAGIIPVAE